MRNSRSPLCWDSGEEGFKITSPHLYWDKMDNADFTIYEVGIMNTHTGMDEDPPRD